MRRGLSRHNNRSGGNAAFNPLSLFADGSQGVWYDDSNNDTLFLDAAGTTVTALESPVGSQLDLRNTAYSVAFNGTSDSLTLNGSAGFAFGTGDFTIEGWWYFSSFPAAYQQLFDFRPTSTSGLYPTLSVSSANAIEYLTNGAVRITAASGMSAATWYHIALSRVSGNTRVFIGGVQKGSTYADSTNYIVGAARPIISSNGFTSSSFFGGNISNLRIVKGTGLYSANFTPPTEPLTAISGTSLLTCGTIWTGNPTITVVSTAKVFQLSPFVTGTGNHRFQTTSANRPTLSARYNLLLATATLATQSITTVATSYTIYFTGSGSVTLAGTYIGTFTAGTNTFTATAGTLVVTVTGSVLTADIRPTNQTTTLPAYQSVVTSSSYDTVGFPQYLKYNGSSSALSTASINFTATAQMSVFSGLRKLSDAAAGYAIELSVNSTSNSGAFYLSAPDSAAANFGAGSGGTTFVSGASASSFLAPTTQTTQILANISAPSLNLYLNNASVLSSTSTQGTGNYGNYAMYFGRRAGTSAPFNGQEYQTIIVGKTLTATQIANTETYVNSKTKAYA
jgi:hypothetical protein